MTRSLLKSRLSDPRMIRALAVFLIGAICLSYVVLTSGCATLQRSKGFHEMSPQEQATMLLGVYNRQYDLYLREAVVPDLTEDKRVVLREKKKALVELYPYLGVYAEYAERGAFAPADVELVVMELVDKLLGI